MELRATATRDPSYRPRGDLLGSRYELRSAIARGGMGLVWRAHDTLLDRQVAVKVLRSDFTHDPTFLTRFRTEARHAALLTDPNIAAVHDYGEDVDGNGEHVAYLVMELVEGVTLATLLRRALGMDVSRTLRIVHQAASALAATHAAGVVHRDVKPGNVLVTPDDVVKLTDFGIAWSASNVALTRTGQVMGTAHYLAPEQVDGEKATPTSDVYSLGVIAYECLAGHRPFEGENSVQTALKHIREVPPPLPADVPDDVRRLVEHAMARQPADRFPDGAALRDAVDAVLAARQTPRLQSHPTVRLATPEPSSGSVDVPIEVEEPGRRGRRPHLSGPVVAAMVAVAALLVLALVVVGVVPGSSAPSSPESPSAPPTAPATAGAPTTLTTLRLAADDLVGRPVAEVQARLVALGLDVQVRAVETPTAPAGLVIQVDPVGDVVPGQAVTVTYAASPPAAPTSAARSTSAPSVVTTPAPTTSAGPKNSGRGNGHGKNH